MSRQRARSSCVEAKAVDPYATTVQTPHPYILHPTACTLHTTPYTPHHTPLHPTPLHPAPHTLHLTPYATTVQTLLPTRVTRS